MSRLIIAGHIVVFTAMICSLMIYLRMIKQKSRFGKVDSVNTNVYRKGMIPLNQVLITVNIIQGIVSLVILAINQSLTEMIFFSAPYIIGIFLIYVNQTIKKNYLHHVNIYSILGLFIIVSSLISTLTLVVFKVEVNTSLVAAVAVVLQSIMFIFISKKNVFVGNTIN